MTLDEWRVMRMPKSRWRRRAREVMIAVVYDDAGGDASRPLLAMVDAAYPFGERKHEPYKCWLAERKLFREALAPTPQLPSQDEADVCEVARDMVIEGRLDDARRLLEQAPNRLARRCPACGVPPGSSCCETRPMPGMDRDPRAFYGIDLSIELLVPHHARLVGHADAGPLFAGPR